MIWPRMMKRELGKTYVTHTMPWGLCPRNGHRLLCSDGVVRAAQLALTPDSFFSHPASIRIKGKLITGYMTVESEFTVEYGATIWRRAYVFRHHDGNEHLLPGWSIDSEEKYKMLRAAGECTRL